MHAIMDALHGDHKNFSRLLSLVTEELVLLQQGQFPDFNLLLDLIDYVENYPDLYHHPREDAIYRIYMERHEEGREAIENLIREHKALRGLTEELRASVEALLHDAIVPKGQLADQLADFIAKQASHLNTEERDIFPLLNRSLTEEEWQRIESEVPIQEDPLFGEHPAEDYRALYDRITTAPHA